MPLLRRVARAEGAALFDLVAGFVNSQVLMALVELRVLHPWSDGPLDAAQLRACCGIPPERMQVLLQAGAGLGLLRRHRDGRFGLARRGAALLGVPGLEAMIRHHRVLYARSGRSGRPFCAARPRPSWPRFWPYVFGAGGAPIREVDRDYST